MIPLHDGPQDAAGALKIGVFVRLMNWAMNCSLNRSVI